MYDDGREMKSFGCLPWQTLSKEARQGRIVLSDSSRARPATERRGHRKERGKGKAGLLGTWSERAGDAVSLGHSWRTFRRRQDRDVGYHQRISSGPPTGQG